MNWSIKIPQFHIIPFVFTVFHFNYRTSKPDSEIGMVDGDFMVDGPSINHGQKAINHKSWLMGRLGEFVVASLFTEKIINK